METLLPLLTDGDQSDARVALAAVADPRRTGWRVHPTGYVLMVLSVTDFIPGFEHYEGAAQWIAAADQRVRRLLGGCPDPLTGWIPAPSASTLRRVASGLDPSPLDTGIQKWLTANEFGPEMGSALIVADDLPDVPGTAGAQLPPEPSFEQALPVSLSGSLWGVSIDGKTFRGAKDVNGRMPHTLGAATHQNSVVLAQIPLSSKKGENSSFTSLLKLLDHAGLIGASTVIALDALHTSAGTVRPSWMPAATMS